MSLGLVEKNIEEVSVFLIPTQRDKYIVFIFIERASDTCIERL